jgi:hypothetical protein
VLTTAVAAIVAGVWATPLPEFARIALCVYFLAIVGYEVIRGPSRNSVFKELRNRREQIAKRRQEILREAEELRRCGRTNITAEASESSETDSD